MKRENSLMIEHLTPFRTSNGGVCQKHDFILNVRLLSGTIDHMIDHRPLSGTIDHMIDDRP